MPKLSAFADEIDRSSLDEQIRVLKANDVHFIELRSVWNKGVLDLTDEEVRKVKAQADANGIGFSAVGSPIGKFPLDGDFNQELNRVKRALEVAGMIGAPYIRMFSYYIPEGAEPAKHRGQVLDWIGQLIAEAEKTDIVLAHENESRIYGDVGDRCLDLLTSLKSDSFTGIFDFSNFVQCGNKPYEECWTKLRDHITYFHIKDADRSTRKVVPAGQGDGDVVRILKEACGDGFDSFLTLEPHLSLESGKYGSTREELFATAANAIKDVLAEIERG